MKPFGDFLESAKFGSVLGSKNNGKTLVDKNGEFWVQHLAIDGQTIGAFNIDEQGNAREREMTQTDVLFYGPYLSEVYSFLKNGSFYKTFYDEQKP